MDLLSIIGLLYIIHLLACVTILFFVDSDLELFFCIHFGEKIDVLRNKIVWITGASSGIGEYLAIELAKCGAKIIITARSVTNLERVKIRCIAESGANENDIAVLPFDITEEDKLEELFEKAISCHGKLDILVNNAGRSQRALFESIESKVDREMFDLNTHPAVALSRLAVKYFENENIEGHIVATSSVAGLIAVPNSCSYNGSKHALHGYLNTLRTEKMDKKLHVTLLCPGPVFSNLLQNCFTAKSGENFGQEMRADDKRMTTKRCAYLSAIAIANQLDEVWIAQSPIILFMYIQLYYPRMAKWTKKLIGVKRLMKLRDSRVTVDKKD